jgi:D-alanyl-D-alanine carboxypeptidase
MRTAVAIIALLLPVRAAGQQASRFDAYLRPFAETNNLSGVVLVSRGGRVLFHKGYGLANPEFRIPNTPETRFHIASISKAFTAVAVLMLEEQGKLKTTDSVARFLPDYPNGTRIRLEHLLTHRSGIPNVADLPELSSSSYVPYTAETIVAAFKDKPLDFDPGARSRYTNSDYNLLALIIERVSGQSFGEFLRTHIFEPFGLQATTHDGNPARVILSSASGTEPEGLRDVKLLPYIAWSTKTGSGSLVSTTTDLCKFASALFGGRMLKPASLAKLMSAQGVFPYGWDERDRFGHKSKGVNGRSPGFISSVEYFLDDGTCVAILTNSYSSVGQVIAPDVTAIALGQPAVPPRIAYVAPRPGSLAPFTGQFQMPADFYTPNLVLTLQDRGGYLEATTPNGSTNIIYPAGGGGDHFVDRTFWAEVDFVRDAQGQVTGFVYRLLRDFTAKKLAS